MGRVSDTGDWRTSFYKCDEWCDWEGLGSQLADGWYSDEGEHGLDCPKCGNQVEIIRVAPPPPEDLQPLPFPTLATRIEAGDFPNGTMFRFWESEKYGLIRQRSDQSGSVSPEIWRGSQWVQGSPYVTDAITGMGEDPYSCGEWAEERGPRQAERLARRQAIDLYAPPARQS